LMKQGQAAQRSLLLLLPASAASSRCRDFDG